jgi:streptomycin 6-kinase
MSSSIPRELQQRVAERIRTWRIDVERTEQSQSSVLVFGRRDGQPVVLKVLRGGDEWRSGEIAAAFEGRGVVRVFDHIGGALLMERLRPGTSLGELASGGGDEEATEVLAAVIRKMSPRTTPGPVPTVQTWSAGFERYIASGRAEIPAPLLRDAHRVYARLCASQSRPRLLHGDLHHANVLYDSDRGWLSIDPKGVVGELEYEIGAALRNPHQMPELFTDQGTIGRRVECFARELHLNRDRILAWAFAQAILASVWTVEDGLAVGPDDPRIMLARAIRPMLKTESFGSALSS